MKKSYRVKIIGLGKEYSHTDTGKPKIWRSDLVRTNCCSFQPSYFVWEKNTAFNGYNAYYGYFHCKNVQQI